MIIRQPENRTVEDYDSLINALVNQIDELYSSPEIRKYCRKLARELHEQMANFIQKVVENPKFDLSGCPWPFGLIIVKEYKGEKPGETTCTQLYGCDRTIRKWKIPDDIAAVHTFLALFCDERLGGDRIVTYEIRDICPYIGISPLIVSDTTETVQKEIPALIRRARADLKAEGLIPESIDNSQKPQVHTVEAENDPKQKRNIIKERFTVKSGQAQFDGKDLRIPTGLACDVLEKLVNQFGVVVKYKDLDDNSLDKEASEQLRKVKSVIVKSFEVNKVPCAIESKTRHGYVIIKKTSKKTTKRSSKTHHK